MQATLGHANITTTSGYLLLMWWKRLQRREKAPFSGNALEGVRAATFKAKP